MSLGGDQVSSALRCGVVLLCLGFLSAQTLAQEHLHLDAGGGSACEVCAHGDTTPLADPVEGAAPPRFVQPLSLLTRIAAAPICPQSSSHPARAPPPIS